MQLRYLNKMQEFWVYCSTLNLSRFMDTLYSLIHFLNHGRKLVSAFDGFNIG